MRKGRESRDLAGVEPSLLVAVFAGSGPFLVLAPVPVALAALVLVACFSRAFSVGVLCLATGAAAVGTWRAYETIGDYQVARAEAASLLRPPARCALLGQVTDSPTVRDETTRFRLHVTQADCAGQLTKRPFLARLYGGPHRLRRGDVVQVNVQLGVARLFRNHDLVDPVPFAARSGVVASGSVLSLELLSREVGLRPFIDRLRNHVRERIEVTFSPGAIGLAKALVLGENDLTQEEDHSFKVSGLAHLLAVSGTHLIFAVVSVVMGARAILVRWERVAATRDAARLACAAGIALALTYADFAGGSGSAWRAAWMLSIAFGLRCLGREVGPAQCVAFSILIGVTLDPLVALDLSFLLSLAATAGLMTCGRSWAARVASVSYRPGRLLLLSAVATVASTIPCSIVLASLATEVSLLGVLANCLAAPFGELIALPLCLLHGLTSWLHPLEAGLAQVASGALLVVRQVALLTARAEGYGLPMPYLDRYQYASVGVLAAALLARHLSHSSRMRRRAMALSVMGSLSFCAAEWRQREHGHPKGQLRATFLDVGQGDSTLVDLPDGSLLLIDGGGFVGVPVDPGVSVILPVLRARRRTSIDVVVISHPHPDHFGGLGSVLTRIEVRELWDTGQGRAHGGGPAYSALLDIARDRGVAVKSPSDLCGRRQVGGAWLSVFGPCPAFSPERSPNDNSFVLQFAYQDASVLLVGDAEQEQERALLEKHGERLRSTVLKVGHHGSRTSSGSAFLRAVRPEFAVVSCGSRNRFGHPHPEAMSRLLEQGSKVWRVDERGSVSWAHPGSFARGWAWRKN